MGKLGMTYGPGGAGKSFVVLDMALCICTGQPWHGKATRQGKVLFVAGEGASGLPARIDAWGSAHNMPTDFAEDRLDIIDGPIDIYSPDGLADRIDLVDMVKEDKYLLVVFDTYNRCTPGLNENDAKDTGVVLRNLAAIQAAGATVLLIHHTPKDGTSPRGSAALEWATDHGLRVTKDGAAITVTNVRQKDHESGDEIYLALVSDQATGSAYLVDSDQQRDRSDVTVGASSLPTEDAYDPFDMRPVGDELDNYVGPGQRMVLPLGQLMAQHAEYGGVGISRAEAAALLGRGVKDGAIRNAWDVLYRVGALTPASGRYTSASAIGRCWWVEPGESRITELTNRQD